MLYIYVGANAYIRFRLFVCMEVRGERYRKTRSKIVFVSSLDGVRRVLEKNLLLTWRCVVGVVHEQPLAIVSVVF